MDYLDTNARNPTQAVGTWLDEQTGEADIEALRWQTGFFGAEALGYFVELLDRLGSRDNVVHVLVGSNDGVTQRRDLEVLLDLVGPPRPNLGIGVVSFENAYFHPKTIHMSRVDGSELAYVGSANLTPSGVASQHVEAGVVLDTRAGDDVRILAKVREAVDWWFATVPEGFTVITGASELDLLEAQGVIGVPRPERARQPSTPSTHAKRRARLAPLLTIPRLPTPRTLEPEVNAGSPTSRTPTTVRWSKKLTGSDAQRKPKGNQRGGITLVAAGYPINGQTYFRYDFFGDADWRVETTRTGQERERAMIQFAADVLDVNVGTLELSLTYAQNREASQANYTTMLHLGPLAPSFESDDMTGRHLVLERDLDGTYALTIS